MKKVFVFFLCSLVLMKLTATAQKKDIFYARFGGNLFFSGNNESDLFVLPSITFAPGIRIAQSKNFAMVMAAPISVGSSLRSYSNSYLGIDAPLMLELNLGSAAGNNDKSHFGFMMGAGAAYHYAGNYFDNYNGPNEDFRHLDFWGYRLESGISFGKGDDGNQIMVLFNYGRGFTAEKNTVIGAGLVFTMGNLK